MVNNTATGNYFNYLKGCCLYCLNRLLNIMQLHETSSSALSHSFSNDECESPGSLLNYRQLIQWLWSGPQGVSMLLIHGKPFTFSTSSGTEEDKFQGLLSRLSASYFSEAHIGLCCSYRNFLHI